MKTEFKYDHYYKYDELEKNLKHFAEEYPDLCTLDVNMVTAEKRNQYVLTITNKKTGEPLSKPGWYLDGNIHAGEVTASMTAMYTIDVFLTNYGSDPEITELIDKTTIYVIPRVSPDGAETYLTTPYNIRSVNKVYHPEKEGIKQQDLDGDGVIRMMRISTPYGAWKKDPEDPSKMVKREPGDQRGTFYDIYPEGILEGDGDNLKQKHSDWGLDFNRNFPLGWFPDGRQPGAGPYPLSNPECKAVVDFVLAHPNIGGAALGHTSGGIILYPPGTRAAKTAPSADIKAFKEIAAMGQKSLGYTPMNIFDSFMTDQENYDSGALDDWFYQSQGIPAYTMEFWDVAKKAGVPYEWGGQRAEETDDVKMQRFNAIVSWVKENAPQYYIEWKPFHHPYFGDVEIGGFNTKFTIQNPPEHLLAETCMQDAVFNLKFANAVPRLSIDEVHAEKLAEETYKITVLVGNKGYLPTYLSEEAKILKTAVPVKVKISGAQVLMGSDEQEAGYLSGYSRTDTGSVYGNLTTFKDAEMKKKLEWIVKASAGDEITVNAFQNKAGTVSQKITL